MTDISKKISKCCICGEFCPKYNPKLTRQRYFCDKVCKLSYGESNCHRICEKDIYAYNANLADSYSERFGKIVVTCPGCIKGLPLPNGGMPVPVPKIQYVFGDVIEIED